MPEDHEKMIIKVTDKLQVHTMPQSLPDFVIMYFAICHL